MTLSSWAQALRRLLGTVATAGLLVTATPSATASSAAASSVREVATPTVEGPIPGSPPGDPASPRLEDTYPFFASYEDLAAAGYVEQEYFLSGTADAYSTSGELVGSDVAYETRIVVRRPAHPRRFNGTVLMEWQNVTAGYDLDALWDSHRIMRAGYAWVGVSAQRVGVDQLTGWSPTRYGDLDVTDGGRFTADEMSYDIFSQAARAVRAPRRGGTDPMGRLDVDTVLAIGASQSAARMTTYYDAVLPQVEPVFDGYGFVVGSAPTRVGTEPVFQVLSETDVRSPVRPRPDSEVFRRWEVAGTSHAGWAVQEYRFPLWERDLGEVPEYECAAPPFSRVPMGHVVAASYDHLVRWVERGTPPPVAEPLQFSPDGTKARNELGLALGGIRLSQAEVPIALNTGDNSGESFCVLFGTHRPFDETTLDELYPRHGPYVAAVARVDRGNVRHGYVLPADAHQNLIDAAHSDVGR
jgi:Alpha/beta hydrolase domain